MRLYKVLFLLIFTFHLFVGCSNSQTEVNIPEAVKSAFQAKYPEVKDASWGKSIDSNGYYEAHFKKNDKKYRADFEESGKWIETEASIKFKDLPKAVQDAIEREYDKNSITEIEEVDNQQKGIFYDVEIDEKGTKRFDIEYNASGEVIGTE